MGKLDGKVAFITGAARGQGRSHAARFAKEGADIIAVDVLHDITSVKYPLGTKEDLEETVAQVEACGRRIVAAEADVREFDALKAALDQGVAEFGRLDIVSANAGVFAADRAEDITEQAWRDVIDINLTGVWHTAKAAIPHLRAGGRGGSIVLTASVDGLRAGYNHAHYISSKHGVIGLTQALALELAAESIRVNAVCPTNVNTPMLLNDHIYGLFAPDLSPEQWTEENLLPRFAAAHPMPGAPWVTSEDVSNAVLWLASDEARFVTGVSLPIDAGKLVV